MVLLLVKFIPCLFAVVVIFYAGFIVLLLNPWLQRQALYAYRFHTAYWWDDIDKPETFGFAKHQVTPFRISTVDDHSLYAWHILPLGLYAKQEQLLLEEASNATTKTTENAVALDLLRNPDSRLIINFHGNAGHVAQGWRPDLYKSFSAIDSCRNHILTFDYRGFGKSSGHPTETGLINDGIAVIDWALNVVKLPPERIVLFGHSLGTAVAAAVADHFVSMTPAVEFSGIVLVSGFSDIPTLMKTYLIRGFIPVLGPLKSYPRLQQWISEHIVDTWDTVSRLTHIAEVSTKMKVYILHSKDDFDIGWNHANLLYDAAVAGMTKPHIPVEVQDRHNARVIQACEIGGQKIVKRFILDHGGHNKFPSYAPVVLEVLKAFEN